MNNINKFSNSSAFPSYLQSDDEITTHIRSINWKETSLGDIDTWPQSLHTTLGLILKSKFPMFLFWGKDLICFYNEGYRPSLGNNAKHPWAIGKPGEKVWPEIWDYIKPMIDKILAGEEATWNEDTLVPIFRNGKMEDVYWTFSYSPVTDETDSIKGVFVTTTETTSKVELLATLSESKSELTELANAMPQLVWVADAKSNITFYNKRILEFAEDIADEYGRWSWEKMLHPEDFQRTIEIWTECMQNGTEYAMEHRLKMKNGDYKWHLSRAFSKKDYEGKIVKWFGTATDIDEIKVHEKRKDDFIKMASHELKTPITSIKGYIQLLQEKFSKSDDSLLPMALNTVERQVNKLTKLISELLDVKTIESGSFGLKKIKFCLNDLVVETLEDVKMIATKHSIDFINAEPLTVFADKERISQVVINLVTNAIKYSPKEGNITVVISSDEHNAIVSVKDLGIGINENEHGKIFENYYRVSGSVEETFPGFGLGLFIVSQILKQHGGKIWLESKPQQGSTFYFSIPLYEIPH
jgi:PAS domain S-box-containing protein